MTNKKLMGILQIVLIISIVFAFSDIANRSYGEESKILEFLPWFGKLVFDDNFVSALNSDDFADGSWTCLETKEGEYCQEFPASECNDKCNGDCVPSRRADVAQCKIGTCQSSETGVCSTGAPRELCEAAGDKWHDDPHGNVPECRLGCCIIGSTSRFVTEQQCNYDASLLGASKTFRTDISNDFQCLALFEEQEEGACVFGDRQCSFTTRVNCEGSIRGDFNAGVLCSHPDLNTRCEAQASTSCIPGEDEVYWLDSCGNKENIFSLPKAASYNNGLVQNKADSCELGSGNDHLANAEVCGNCNYLASSTCRQAGAGEVSFGNFVCGDLSCIDELGNTREHGESWCSYQGRIGVDETNDRSTDTPGSRHFRNTCVRGEVQEEACSDYRNEVCVESRSDISGEEVSVASCRINRWQQCIQYNTLDDREETLELCNSNPDCFVKDVEVGSGFGVCAPKYPAGFDLQSRGEGAEGICGLGSQSCTAWFKGSKCVANCDCVSEKFTEEMNNLCVSLGDCGASVNYLGDLSESYSIDNAPRLGAGYLSGLRSYSNEDLFKGQYADAGSLNEYFGDIGFPGFLDELPDDSSVNEFISTAQLPVGAIGSIIPLAAKTSLGAKALGSVGLACSGGCGVLTAFGGAAVGASIGFSLVSLVLQLTGVGAGLPEWAAYTLMAAGAIGGAMAGIAVVQGGGLSSLFGGGSVLGPVGLIIVVVVIVVIVILSFFGFGKKPHPVQVNFQCKPWQPPLGGASCGECGSDGFPCTRYACHSLGQTCELINENTDAVACIDNNPNDVTPPKIQAWKEVINDGHQYNEKELGVEITRSGECLQPYTNLIFGLQTDEVSQCKASTVLTSNYDEMDQQFGVSSLFKKNHTALLQVPDLRQLGLVGYIPANATAEYDLFVRCQDKNGNTNTAEYNINFCVQKGIDISPPVINRIEKGFDFLAFDESERNVSIFVNEPSECRWSFSDKDYEDMENSWQCKQDISDQVFFGFECSADLPVTGDDNNYHVRCKDNPGIPEEGIVTDIVSNGKNLTQTRNTNQESKVINLKKSLSELKIDSVSPEGEVVSGVEPATITLEVETSGGALNGDATCYYSFGDVESQFFDTYQKEHKQVFQSLFSGSYTVPVRCEDRAGNEASTSIAFSVDIDTDAPRVVRTYASFDLLTVVTDEAASCRYSTESCNYNFQNGTLMSGSNSRSHSTSFDRESTYYVKCEDEFDRGPGSQCSVVVKGQRV